MKVIFLHYASYQIRIFSHCFLTFACYNSHVAQQEENITPIHQGPFANLQRALTDKHAGPSELIDPVNPPADLPTTVNLSVMRRRPSRAVIQW